MQAPPHLACARCAVPSVLAKNTVQVTSDAKASPIITAFTTRSASRYMPHERKLLRQQVAADGRLAGSGCCNLGIWWAVRARLWARSGGVCGRRLRRGGGRTGAVGVRRRNERRCDAWAGEERPAQQPEALKAARRCAEQPLAPRQSARMALKSAARRARIAGARKRRSAKRCGSGLGALATTLHLVLSVVYCPRSQFA